MDEPFEPGPDRRGVRSVEIAARLLREIAAAGGPMALKDLAAAAGMAPSKAHRYLVSLIRGGLVARDPAGGGYDFGPTTLELGLAALNRLDVIGLASAALGDLVRRVGETGLIAVWGNRGPTIVRWAEGARPVTVNVRVGSVMPLLSSATGRVFAAWLPGDVIAPHVRDELSRPAAAPGAPRDRDEVARLLAEVRRRGLGRVEGDLLPGVAALGAPVFDHTGGLVAVLTLLGAEGSFDADPAGALAGALRAAARALSARLGYSVDETPGGPRETAAG